MIDCSATRVKQVELMSRVLIWKKSALRLLCVLGVSAVDLSVTEG
jgi:hypothetical protein